MFGKATSFFIVGLCCGVLSATLAFALVLRSADDAHEPGGSPTRVLKLAHSLDEKHPVHQALLQMAETLDQKSRGRLSLEIFANSQLGSEAECVEQLQQGALDLTKTSAGPLENFIPEIAVLGVPYVFRSEDHCWKVLEGPIGDELLAAGERVGFKGLCYFDAGARSFYTVNRAILSPDDLVGLKIRVQQSKTAMAMVEALGGSPTPIDWGELYSALQTNQVDGAENNLPSFYSNRHFEVCRHFTRNEHTRVPDVLLVSEQTWQALSPDEQRWLQEAAYESADRQRQLWSDETKRVLQALEAEGVAVHVPDLAPFIEKVQDLHHSYDGTQVGGLMQRIAEE
ncbi:Sialic acid-binding periplasmic protein SiaP precursor [Posidoniimonas polymericola]|uniref:Sialic acid-binding periplasmic protein SiaP n=1 Tax=Posidoniimonas polymericola TaxID=2528002 RepID=A0A5C5YQ43_9BACT|nr:TRAP transporter substrate-binding protein [Posidoniimonas polymericola]TWT77082.1 Sialic acid-binding periplasmic protein SiaP precursor [Posidoniimonas polymericola]